MIWLMTLLRLSYLGGDVPELATWEERETLGAITFAIFTFLLWALTSRRLGQWLHKQESLEAFEGSRPGSNHANEARDLRLSASEGDSDAMYLLGMMYSEGHGVSVNHLEAAQWFLKAAELGNHSAQFMLGAMYQAGQGVTKTVQEAIRWWRKAAEQGNSMAQYNLGMMYAMGEGVHEDPLEARRWVEKAAQQGESRAFYNLGVLYKAEPKDYIQAHKWLSLSATNNEKVGKAKSMKAELERAMTPTQIAEAERQAREWTPHESSVFVDTLKDYRKAQESS